MKQTLRPKPVLFQKLSAVHCLKGTGCCAVPITVRIYGQCLACTKQAMLQLRLIPRQRRPTTAVAPKPKAPVPYFRRARMIVANLMPRSSTWSRPSELGLSILARHVLAVWSSSEKKLAATISSAAVVQASAMAAECVTLAQIVRRACAVLRAPVFPSLLIGYKCLVHWHTDVRRSR